MPNDALPPAFSAGCHITTKDGIKGIHNPATNAFIPLDPEGIEFIEALGGNVEIGVEELTENKLHFMKAMTDGGFFKQPIEFKKDFREGG